MKKLTLILMLLIAGLMAVSCGHSDEPEPEKPDEITRVQDGNGKIFLENGSLVEANTAFSEVMMNQALAETNWKRSYSFLYDNHHVSGVIEYSNRFIPLELLPDKNANFSDNTTRTYSISGRTISFTVNPLSSTFFPTNSYTIVAIDYTESLKRMVTDVLAASIVLIPEGYDTKTTTIRIVWISE